MSQGRELLFTSYTPEELYTIMYRAEQNGAFVAHIQGEWCPTIDCFFRQIASAMRFPYYFGENWAAFDECITDLEWLKFSSILIVIDDQEKVFLHDNSPDEIKKLLIKYLSLAVEYWVSQNIPIVMYLNQR